MKRPVYTKEFSRDFTLETVSIWCDAESTDPRQWTDKQQPKKPFLFFVRDARNVSVYYDTTGIDWIKQELNAQRKQNSNFVTHTIQTFNQKYNAIKDVFENKPILPLEKLNDFTHKLRDLWAWFEAVWWLIDLLEKEDNPPELPALQKIRKQTENLAIGGEETIIKSLARTFPDKAQYASVILVKEAIENKIPSNERLEQRLKHYIYTNKAVFEDKTLQDIEEEYGISIKTEKAVLEGSEFSGQTAFPGKAKGNVRKILNKRDIPTMQEGEILVAAMTTPDYMPALKKAAAIVTDEGGIISHAAIVSRELKTPCIMGTKIATDVLENGDVIEVDATKGKVKKITQN